MRMIVAGSGEISSTEGTTQGDPLAMAMYALAVYSAIDPQTQEQLSGFEAGLVC